MISARSEGRALGPGVTGLGPAQEEAPQTRGPAVWGRGAGLGKGGWEGPRTEEIGKQLFGNVLRGPGSQPRGVRGGTGLGSQTPQGLELSSSPLLRFPRGLCQRG